MKQKVLLIKDPNVLTQVKRCLQEDFKAGYRRSLSLS